MAIQKLMVGIFSRDGQDNYKWLVNVLQGAMFLDVVQYVFPVYITNNFRSFTDALAQCSFAILYHTKKRGRLNIANVTDSLYDVELQDLKDHLSAYKVIVLVDDVDDSGIDSQNRILNQQSLIGECAHKLVLISESEKQAAKLTGPDPRLSPAPISQAARDDYDSMHDKISMIRSAMEQAMGPDFRKQNPPNTNYRTRNDSYSDSVTQSEGHKSSATTKSVKSVSYRNPDLDSVRSSSAYSSDRSTRPLFNKQRSTHDDFRASHDETNIHIDGEFPRDSNQRNKKRQKSEGGRVFPWCKNLSDKAVFIIIGVLVAVFFIILIIILCVAI